MSDELSKKVAQLAAKYRPLASDILAELVRIPADHVKTDLLCGQSNHEGARLEWLRKKIVAIKAVERAEDVDFDAFGNLVWTVQDPDDGVAAADKKVIYFDGHSDTVAPLREQWAEKLVGIDAFYGLTDASKVNRKFLRDELGHIPPDYEWEHLRFGRGTADQLGGVVSQVIATKILLELRPEGTLKGAIVRSYATVAEEDNDGAGPMYLMTQVLPGAGPELIPDVVILTEGTGDAKKGALGIYRGQRGRMQIEVTVQGKSCHGSMPWEGLNPLEYGAAILSDATEAAKKGKGFAEHPFLGAGTRTASWAKLDTPSDCAVPDRFIFRFDRRLTVGETPKKALADVAKLPSVARARKAGLTVTVEVPHYDTPTWKGYAPDNAQIYPGWETPEDHDAIQAAVATYKQIVTPNITPSSMAGGLRSRPRVDRWIFSTDGVGFPVPIEGSGIEDSPAKKWVHSGEVKHPAMFGVGPGIEQNTHKIGECVDLRELQQAVAFLARFPTVYAKK